MSKGTKTKTTIELNGQLYDARTGKIIGAPGGPATATVPHTALKPSIPPGGKAVDGFVRRSRGIPVQTATAPALPIAAKTKSFKPTEISRATVSPPKSHAVRHIPSYTTARLEKSTTLMRPAVKKPKAVIDHTPAPPSYKKENHERTLRAATAEKSLAIHRFHPVNQHTIVKKETILPMAAPGDHLKKQISHQVAHLATSTEARVYQSVDIIEESLRSASAHLETFEDNVVRSSFWTKFGFKNKTANLTSLSFAGLLLVGFFAYQNTPNIEMRLASAQSGFSAQMPGYSPAGFSATRDIKSEPGKVSVTFRSNTDDKKFTVTQEASNWSSDSLLNSQVLASKQPYQTYQEEGKTVYIINDSNATWVNGGVLYRIDGDVSLTSNQLLRIANSL